MVVFFLPTLLDLDAQDIAFLVFKGVLIERPSLKAIGLDQQVKILRREISTFAIGINNGYSGG